MGDGITPAGVTPLPTGSCILLQFQFVRLQTTPRNILYLDSRVEGAWQEMQAELAYAEADSDVQSQPEFEHRRCDGRVEAAMELLLDGSHSFDGFEVNQAVQQRLAGSAEVQQVLACPGVRAAGALAAHCAAALHMAYDDTAWAADIVVQNLAYWGLLEEFYQVWAAAARGAGLAAVSGPPICLARLLPIVNGALHAHACTSLDPSLQAKLRGDGCLQATADAQAGASGRPTRRRASPSPASRLRLALPAACLLLHLPAAQAT